MEKTKEEEVLRYIQTAIPDIARKCRVMQEDVIECFKYLINNEI